MLNAIIRYSLRYRMLVVFLSLAALVYGAYVTAGLPIDVFPDLDRPRVVILTEAHNLAPEEIETLITFPIESAVLGATGVQAVRSSSMVGQSIVTVEFDWGVPIFTARQLVQERLTSLQGTFPPGIRPELGPVSSLMGQIMLIGVTRQTGPNGGELAPVGKTALIAELSLEAKEGKATLHFWNPVNEQGVRTRDIGTWKPADVAKQPVTLRFTRVNAAPHLPNNGPADDSFRFQNDPSQKGWLCTDERLRSETIRFQDRERRMHIKLEGAEREVVFPAASQQQLDLRTSADWDIRPRLLKIPGTAQVVVMGGGRKQYQVLVDPMALSRYDVTLQDVEAALKKNNLNTSGGYAFQGDKEKPIRVFGRLGPDRHVVLRDLEEVVVKVTPNRNLLVKDVARVVEGAQIKRGDSSVNGDPSVLLTVMKQPHRDTRALTNDITAALREVEASLPLDIVINTEIFQTKGFIDRAIYNVGEALVIGAVLVLIILFLFLLNFRTTFISLTAIPLSLVLTGLVFKLMSWITGTQLSINVMTLGGIAVAMGELVDDAIVDVENIFRRLRENNLLDQPRNPLTVIYEASIEVRGAIVFGTIMVILVFIPLFALSGMEGRLFAPLGIAYIVSILASLLVSLTVTPVLSYYLLPQSQAAHRHTDSPLLTLLKWLASHLVRFSMNWAGTLLAVTWILVAVCAFLLTQIGADFLPKFDEGTVQLNIDLPAGSSLEASNELGRIVDETLRAKRKTAKNPDGAILHFSRRTGRSENEEHADPVNNTEYFMAINPDLGKKRDDILDEIVDDIKAAYPGVEVESDQPLQHLISHMLTGVKAQIAIKVYGDDLDVLHRSAERVRDSIKNIPGMKTAKVEAQEMIDEMHIKLRRNKLAFYGVDRYYVAEFIGTALKGEDVTQVIDGQRRFDVIVRLEDRYRTDYANLGKLRLELPDRRGTVMLKELATFHTDGVGANQISRENARRRIVVRCNVEDRDLASVVADVKREVEEEVQKPGHLPPGYAIEYGGQFENQAEATRLISILAAVSVIGMFVILSMLFPSTRVVLQILNALPTAFIGGVLALLVTQQSLTVASMVGFISLGGIAARNGILLVTHYFHLMKYEGEGFTEKMVLRGSLERLSPVLMTALTAGIGLIPLVYGGQEPGREILYPVATVILGGLITSTLCEFLIHPGLFWRFSGQDAEQLVKEMDHEEDLAKPSAVGS